jgi:endonuclease/exonuclease/phosphatase family metal-dependent hydrolase
MSRTPRLAVPRLALLLAALAALAVTLFAIPAADAAKKKAKPPSRLTVMTRNIYLGADISEPIGSKTPAEFAAKNTHVWNTVIKTNFPARAKLLAKEIKKNKPNLIGLQEVALWRKSAPGTANQPGQATIVVYDFLKSLQKELKANGLRYSVGVKQNEANVEGPVNQGYDVRLTMRDVILVKKTKGLKIRKRRSAQYKADIGVPTAVGPVTVKRGWTALDLTYAKQKFRFLNTHLESFLEGPRVAQAKELVAKGGPATVKGPVILVGDLNSDPQNLTGASPVAYKTLTGFGFKDSWLQIKARNKSKGFECCLKTDDLSDTTFPGDHRIDHTLIKGGKFRGIKATIVGRKRSASGLWPSDHGGVATVLKFKGRN